MSSVGPTLYRGSATPTTGRTGDLWIDTSVSPTLKLYDGADWITLSGGTGTSDHGSLTGLADDDHSQYYNQSRGDARYSLTGHTHGQLHDRSHAITGLSDHTANNWKVFYSNGSGAVVELALGASDTYLKSNGTTSAPTFEAISGGVTAGDKGDITVSGGGTWTIDNGVVTYAKMQGVSAQDRILGRAGSVDSNIVEITCTAAGRNLLDDADNSAQRTTLGLGNSATLNTGTSAGTVATGDHTHTQLHDPVTVSDTTSIDLTLTGQQISAAAIFGSGAGTVAEGNHTHAQLHDRSHAITSTSDHTAGNWKLFYSNGSGQVTELDLGSTDTYLKSAGTASAPVWATPSGVGGGLTYAQVLSITSLRI